MIHFYTNSIKAWDAMIKDMKSAKRSIYIEMYIFSDDTSDTHDFIGVLEEKAISGVQVILILESFENDNLSQIAIDRLEKAGAEILFFHHWIWWTHKKLVIVDGEIAFIGGTNIVKHSSKWIDLQIKTGKQIARKLVKIFSYSYVSVGGKSKIVENIFSHKHKIKTWIINHLSLSKRKKLRKYYEGKISGANSSVTIVTPYFVPAKWFKLLIIKAIKKGISVTILVPRNTDFYFLDKVNSYYTSIFENIGCKIFFSDIMNHAKILVIDKKEGAVGSWNLDSLSFERNNEIGVFFKDKGSILKLNSIVDNWIKSAIRYNENIHRLQWYELIFVPIIRFLHPLL